MDPRTIQYCDEHAEELFALYEGAESGPARYFKFAFPPGAEILDIGAGSGRDLGILIREQYEAYGVEPSPRLRALATRVAGRAGRIYDGALPGLSTQIGRKFDEVLCAAVFQHIPREQQFDAAFDIRNLLKPDGRLLVSVPKDRPGIDASGRDERGRLYTQLVPEELELLFERLGFQRIGAWEDADSLGRPGIRWTTLLFVLRSDQALRPIDRIEGVLNRDRKVATYKLALFRALCDIALTNYHLAEWMPDGRVAGLAGSLKRLQARRMQGRRGGTWLVGASGRDSDGAGDSCSRAVLHAIHLDPQQAARRTCKLWLFDECEVGLNPSRGSGGFLQAESHSSKVRAAEARDRLLPLRSRSCELGIPRDVH